MNKVLTGYDMVILESKLRIIIRNAIKESLDGTYWGGDRGNKITLRDVLNYFEDNEIKPIKMNTEDIFYKFSSGKEVLHIIEKGGKESEARVKNASLVYPITVVKREGNIEYVLDGNHRLQKAKDIGEEFIEVNVLDLNDPSIPEEFANMF